MEMNHEYFISVIGGCSNGQGTGSSPQKKYPFLTSPPLSPNPQSGPIPASPLSQAHFDSTSLPAASEAKFQRFSALYQYPSDQAQSILPGMIRQGVNVPARCSPSTDP